MLKQTLKSICKLQPHYSNKNTPEMQESGRLINRELTACLRSLSELLSKELGTYGDKLLTALEAIPFVDEVTIDELVKMGWYHQGEVIKM